MSALGEGKEALQEYEDMRSPFADDWATLALTLKHALETALEELEGPWEYGFTGSRVEDGRVVEGGYVHGPYPSEDYVARAWSSIGELEKGTVMRRRMAGEWEKA